MTDPVDQDVEEARVAQLVQAHELVLLSDKYEEKIQGLQGMLEVQLELRNQQEARVEELELQLQQLNYQNKTVKFEDEMDYKKSLEKKTQEHEELAE